MSNNATGEGNSGSTRSRKLAFYAITISFSFLFALLVIEIILRNSDYITSTNIIRNSAVDRWLEKHWHVNELGYRDLLIAPRLSSTKPKLYFLGDSFTAGHGVDFKDTYYFKVGIELENDYNLFNISQPGLSTLGEKNEFLNFTKTINSSPDAVIHQYFVNDIEDYISAPSWKSPGWLAASSRHLESAQLVEILLFNHEHGKTYRRSLLGAYRNADILEKHKSDLKILHQHIRDNGSAVIFLTFPALRNKNIHESSFVIKEMHDFFSKTCQPNDIFIDASPAALSLKESERVASILDDHPSPELHSLIANQIIRVIRRESAEDWGHKTHETCASLKAAQDTDTQP